MKNIDVVIKEVEIKGYKLVLKLEEGSYGYYAVVDIYNGKGEHKFGKEFYYKIEAEAAMNEWIEKGFKIKKGLLYVND